MPQHSMGLHQVVHAELRKNNYSGANYRCTLGAHRGDSLNYTENTLAALQAANENDRYAFIEFDVQYSKDRQIVVFHDRRLLRVFGSLKTIGESLLEDLLELTDGEITTYQEAMAVVDKPLNIEIKSQGDLEEDKKLADELIADIRRLKRESTVMISSISSEVIRYVKEVYPEFKTGKVIWLTTSTYLNFDNLTEQLFVTFNDTNADYLLLHVANLRNLDNLLRLKPKGKTILFWDFDDTIYLVHKDNSDRLWGDSVFKEFLKDSYYSLAAPFKKIEPPTAVKRNSRSNIQRSR